MAYHTVDHTADFGIKVFGARDISSLFLELAYGIISEICAGSENSDVELEVFCVGFDEEDLLVSFLNEILFMVQAKDFRVSEISIDSISGTGLKAKLKGSYCDSPLRFYVKAATQHNLKIVDSGRGYETTVIFDV